MSSNTFQAAQTALQAYLADTSVTEDQRTSQLAQFTSQIEAFWHNSPAMAGNKPGQQQR
jgi:lysophospholipid acyltransferase (LPLAT)-like uncharacterized protein